MDHFESGSSSLSMTESQLRAILDCSPTVVYVKDRGGRHTLVNRQFEIVSGLNRRQVIGRTCSDFFPNHIAQALCANDRRVIETGQPVEFEEVIPQDDGFHTYSSTKFPVRGVNGAVIGVCGFSRDITARKRAEAALRESEERFRQMAEHIREVFWLTDVRPHRLIYVSPAYEEVWGRPCDSLHEDDTSWRKSIHPEDRPRVMKAIETESQQGTYLAEYRIVRPDGSVRWILDRGFPIRNEAGEVYRVAGVAQDITEIKQYQERIEKQNRELELRNWQLERATRLKNQFLSSVSHELRTPLNAILGFSQLLGEDDTGHLSNNQKRYLGHIQDGGQHLERLTLDILDLSKIEAGQLELNRQDLRIDEVFEETLSIVDPLAAIKRIHLDMCPQNVWVHADRFRCKQILLNLLSNAIKFTPEGGCVKVEASADSEFAYISVADTGIGIAAEYREKIFEEFYQLSQSTSGRKEGTGLGLSISKRLVEQQGGSISVCSKPGQGSRFTFTLPAGQAHADTSSDSQRPHNAAHPVTARTNPVVLVVDDEQSARDLLTDYLESEGYTVLAAASGAEAIENVRRMRPAAITLDILMPGSGGMETLFQFKNMPEAADIPIIIVSGMDLHNLVPMRGAQAYVTKPVDRAKLLDVLRKCLRPKNSPF